MGGSHLRTHRCTQHIYTMQAAATVTLRCHNMETSSNTIVAYYQTLSTYKLTVCVQPVTYIHENTYP